MYKNSIGELKLMPIKDEGKFIFVNDTIRLNNKNNKGDSIKILVSQYQLMNGKHLLPEDTSTVCKLTVRGEKMELPIETPFDTIEELYDKASEFYKNQFYFGKN